MFYFELFEALYLQKVRYLVVGGLAVNLHGVPRVTYDIDLIISTDRNNVLKLNKTLKVLGYTPRLRVNPNNLSDEKIVKEWIKNRNMIAFSFYHEKETHKIIDIVLVHPLDFKNAFKQKEARLVENIKIYVASLDTMILMKKASNRPKDLSDLKMLKEAKKIIQQKYE